FAQENVVQPLPSQPRNEYIVQRHGRRLPYYGNPARAAAQPPQILEHCLLRPAAQNYPNARQRRHPETRAGRPAPTGRELARSLVQYRQRQPARQRFGVSSPSPGESEAEARSFSRPRESSE